MEVTMDIKDDNIWSRLGSYMLLATATYLAWSIIYAFLISPVKHVPGPILSRLSSIPYRWATFTHRRSAYAHELIKRYGPLVVIAPDQVHTSDDVAMKTIYDRTAIKTKFYAGMGSWKGIVTTLGKLDYASAAPTRANLIQCFQNRNLLTLTDHVDKHVFEFVKKMQELAEGGQDVDGVVWFRLLALDIVTDVLWGDQTNLVSTGGKDTPDFLRRFFAFSSYNALKSFIPGLDLFVRYLGPPRWSQLRRDCLDMDVTARQALERWNQKGEKAHDKDVLSMLSSMQDTKDPGDTIRPDDLPAYMVEMMAAGSSTTSHTAAFACWALASHPEVQTQLRQELFEIYTDADQLDMRACHGSVWLDAIIKETMRLWPMIPGPLERHLGKPITVGKYTVPQGVIASTSALTSGRRAEIFPEPERWIPSRWLNETDDMKLNWTPFGYGSRICPGSNLALTELKYMLAAIFRKFKSVEPAHHEQKTLELADVFAAGSATGHCWLRFEIDSKTP